MLKSKPRPKDVIKPKMGIIDKTAFMILTTNMHNHSRPKTTVDCNACQRTLRFFSKNKKKRPDIQKNT
jgi:hypothetical protein